MTIGQRIAERRKLLGISQEALGEQMGVSRQAISKWEADGAIPEIDKLIALSKLFGVSVGWLLGTESEDSPKPETWLSEEQLITMEKIVQKYQQPQRKSLLMLVCLACAVAALILSVVGLSKADGWVGNREYQLGELPNANLSIRGQLQQMSDQLEELAVGEPILADFETETGTLENWNKGRVTFRAAPMSRQSGDEAYLSLWQNGEEKYFLECIWTGAEFQVEAEVAYGKYEGYFVQCRGNVFQMQNVTPELACLFDIVQPECFLGVRSKWWDNQNGKLHLGSLGLQVEPPRVAVQGGNAKWTMLDLVVKHNGEEILRMDVHETFPIDPRLKIVDPSGTLSDAQLESMYRSMNTARVNVDRERQEPLVLELPELTAGDQITFAVEGCLNNGYSFEQDVYIIGF